VIINRVDMGDNRVVEYCRSEHIPVVLTIPDNRKIAEGYSRGEHLLKVAYFLRPRFIALIIS